MTGIKWVGPVKLSEITQYIKSKISFRTSNSLQSFAIFAVYEILFYLESGHTSFLFSLIFRTILSSVLWI